MNRRKSIVVSIQIKMNSPSPSLWPIQLISCLNWKGKHRDCGWIWHKCWSCLHFLHEESMFQDSELLSGILKASLVHCGFYYQYWLSLYPVTELSISQIWIRCPIFFSPIINSDTWALGISQYPCCYTIYLVHEMREQF